MSLLCCMWFFFHVCSMKVWAVSYSVQTPWHVLITPCVMPFHTTPAPSGWWGQDLQPPLGVKQLYPAVCVLKASRDL